MRSKHRTAPATTRSSEASVEGEIAHLRDLVHTENLIRVNDVMESPKLAE
jgi:hypothetical protein